MTTLLYLMACLMSPAPLINLAESRVQDMSAILVNFVHSPSHAAKQRTLRTEFPYTLCPQNGLSHIVYR
jgi:hypothetical protein